MACCAGDPVVPPLPHLPQNFPFLRIPGSVDLFIFLFSFFFLIPPLPSFLDSYVRAS